MKVRVTQAHEVPRPEGGWEKRLVGQELEIEENDFAPNLHERISAKPTKPEKPAKPEDKKE